MESVETVNNITKGDDTIDDHHDVNLKLIFMFSDAEIMLVFWVIWMCPRNRKQNSVHVSHWWVQLLQMQNTK